MKNLHKISALVVILVLLAGCSGGKKPNESPSQNNEPTQAATPLPTTEVKSTEEPVTKDTNKPVPASGLYTDMVVDKQEYVPLKKDDKVVYITFDDGPCESTPELLALLKKLDVKATFFVTAQFGSDEQVVEWCKQIHNEGHGLGIHTYSHEYTEIYKSTENFLADYKKMDDLIIKATGERTHIYRFPGGSNAAYNKAIRADLIKDLTSRGIIYYDWNAYDGDCDGYNRNNMISKSVRECTYKNKEILLMHNMPNKQVVIKALPDIVNQLKKKGYRFEALDGTQEPIQFEKQK